MVDSELVELIRKYAVKNAVDYGKASAGNVMNKVIPTAKGIPIAELRKAVDEIVNEVNSMPKSMLSSEYEKYRSEFEEQAKDKAEKSAGPHLHIDGAEMGKVFTRFPPEPGGYIQIGNMKQCILSEEFAKLYNGKIYLYFDDTNPEKCQQKYVDAIREDTKWMGVKFSKEYFASDYIEKIYEYGKELIRHGKAYVCFCSLEKIKEGRLHSIECEHRSNSIEKNLELFDEMLAGKFNEGEAIVRLKGDMKAANDLMRDPTLFRIKKLKHYRQGSKYIVWPTYHMNTPIIDSLNGISDVIRGKEYEKWEEVHRAILTSLGFKLPRFHYEARLRIEGNTTAKRVIRELIANGTVDGWDDPRLVTIAALRRRGIQPEAIRKFVLRSGMSKYDGIATMDALLHENAKIINNFAKHLFFVEDPVKLSIDGISQIKVKMPTLQGKEDFREYTVSNAVYISKKDFDSIEIGDIVRLKEFVDVRITQKDNAIAAEKSAAKYSKIIQWVPEGSIKCSVMIPKPLLDKEGNIAKDSMSVAVGYAEKYCERLQKGDIVQFERFGYCILDNKDEMRFIMISPL